MTYRSVSLNHASDYDRLTFSWWEYGEDLATTTIVLEMFYQHLHNALQCPTLRDGSTHGRLL